MTKRLLRRAALHTKRRRRTLRLVRDVRNPVRFVSFGRWDDAEAVQPTELVTLARVTGGTLEEHSPPADIEAIHAPG